MKKLAQILTAAYGYKLDESTLEHYKELARFRSIWINGRNPRLLINRKLLPSQKAFLFAREIGYRYLGLKEHTTTSSWLKVESFEQVLNNFKASYFAGALLMNQDLLRKDLAQFFGKSKWSGERLLALLRKYGATPEMFFYRLSQLIPQVFDLTEMFYLRFNHEAGSQNYSLTKELNMSRVLVPHGISLNEHYCRRWLSIRLLQQLAKKKKKSVLVDAQRSYFQDNDVEFFVITLARPLVLTEGTNSSITLGILINDAFRKHVRFWNDPAVARIVVNETCERCGLSQKECRDRVAPATIYRQQQSQKRREEVLEQLLQELRN